MKIACRRAKRRWLAVLSADADRSYKTGNTKQVYKLIRKISGKRSPQSGIGIKADNGELLYEEEKIKKRWYEYGKQLFGSDTTQSFHAVFQPTADELEPEVMSSEIRAAIQKLKNDKAAGLDGIYGEMLKAGGETVVQALKTIIDHVWKTGEWPSDWTRSEIITLPKVPGTQECAKHRTISLLCHASKVLLEVLRSRIAQYIMPQIAEEQFGFVTGKGTTEAILTLRNIIEKTVKRQEQQLWLMFVDYAKAFDTVSHSILWKTLIEFGTPKHLVWLLDELYSAATGVIRVTDDHTDQFRFEKGVRQGCIVSPMLFNARGEAIMRQVEESLSDRSGCIIGGRAIWNIRYADDTTLIARSKSELEKQAVELSRCSSLFGLQINSAKTHVMALSSNQPVYLDGHEIDQVDRFKYLGSMVGLDSDCTPEIRARLATGRAVTSQLTILWKASEISLKLKKQLVRSLVWSVALYGAESWTLKEIDKKKITAFELWVWRRVLRVSWVDRKTNTWIRETIGVPEEYGLLAEVRKRKLAIYNHWKRRPDSLVLATIEGEVEGKTRPGRRRTAWIDDIKTWTVGGLVAARLNAQKKDAYGPLKDYGL